MEEHIQFKINLNIDDGSHEIRRFLLECKGNATFSSLKKKLQIVFPHLKNETFSVTWQDEDHDVVTVANDEELLIAMNQQKGPVFKFTANTTNIQQRQVLNVMVKLDDETETEYGGMDPDLIEDMENMLAQATELCDRGEKEIQAAIRKRR